jgi:nicotinate-nucleotide pyrophosphorylase (carboxylating)
MVANTIACEMGRDFHQIEWDDLLADDCRQVVRLAVREDLELEQDWTTVALVPPGRVGSADIVARQAGVVAGMPALATALDEMGAKLTLEPAVQERQRVEAGARLARVSGDVRDLLTCERTLLNLLGRMMGVATLAAEFVRAVDGTGAQIYDTRKTTPGWRRLEKYAVACGGAHNHRTGLFDAILIKDNHLAQAAAEGSSRVETVAAAVRKVRHSLAHAPGDRSLSEMMIEVEVDGLDQLAAVLPERPDVVLLDNMSVEDLRRAVAIRNERAPGVELEASGGVNLATVRAIAETGVERISVGSLTHGARSLDVALDWAAAAGPGN